MSGQSYKDLKVWQKAMELARSVYSLTEQFPGPERYGLVSQMRSAAISIPSNIAEGSRRGSSKDFSRFLRIAYGSGSELETQIELSKILKITTEADLEAINEVLDHVMRMLNRLISTLR